MQPENNQNHFLKRNKGFTLVEVLIAMAIFAIGILAVAKMQMWNVKNNTTGNIRTTATMLARAQMEELKSVADVTTLVSNADPNNPVDEDGNAGGIYTRTWTVTNPLGGSDSRQIVVTVSWSRWGQNRSVVLTSITRGNGT